MLAGCHWWISIRFRQCFVLPKSRNNENGGNFAFKKRTSSTAFRNFNAHRLLRNNSERWSPRSSDNSFSRGCFSTLFFPGSWSKFFVDMCWNLSPFCTLNKHSQSRQQSPDHDEFFYSRTAASFLGVSFVNNIEEWPPLAKFARQQHLVIRKHKPQTPTKNLQYSVHVTPAKHQFILVG